MKLKNFLLVSMTVIFTLIAVSCSGNKSADASDLLATVPNDVSMVTVVNVESVLKKMGCKIDGTIITPGKETERATENIKDPNLKKLTDMIINGESGIEPTVAVIFQEGYNTFVTGIAAEPSDFKNAFEKAGYASFSKTNGVEVSDNVAVAGNQFWICLNKYIDPDDIRHFTSIDKTQSFLENKYAENLLVIGKEAEGWANIAGLLNSSVENFQERAMIKTTLELVFDDPSSVVFTVEMNKNEILAEAKVLNSKYKTAKYLLPVSEVDVKTLEWVKGNADGLFAMAVPHSMIEKLQKETSGKGVSLLGEYLKALDSVDGTLGIAFSGENYSGVIGTTGKNTASLMDFVSLALGIELTPHDKVMTFSHGNGLSGKTSVTELSANFDDAVAGIFVSEPDKFISSDLDSFSLMAYSKDGGLLFKAKLINNDN